MIIHLIKGKKKVCVYTSRKQAFGPPLIRALVPVTLRTGTNEGISPGSCSQDAWQGSESINPGSYETFSPGFRYEPGLNKLWQGRHPLIPVETSNQD